MTHFHCQKLSHHYQEEKGNFLAWEEEQALLLSFFLPKYVTILRIYLAFQLSRLIFKADRLVLKLLPEYQSIEKVT